MSKQFQIQVLQLLSQSLISTPDFIRSHTRQIPKGTINPKVGRLNSQAMRFHTPIIIRGQTTSLITNIVSTTISFFIFFTFLSALLYHISAQMSSLFSLRLSARSIRLRSLRLFVWRVRLEALGLRASFLYVRVIFLPPSYIYIIPQNVLQVKHKIVTIVLKILAGRPGNGKSLPYR